MKALSMKDVSDIRESHKYGKSNKDLAEEFGVHPSHISRIVNNKVHTGHVVPKGDKRKFKGYYVYSIGKVWSIRRGIFLKPDIDKDGYRIVRLGKNGKAYKVHRLVLRVFDGPAPANKPIARHLDGDPSNNSLHNLKWGTNEANWRDRKKHGRTNSSKGEKNGTALLTNDEVREIRSLKIKRGTIPKLAKRYRVRPYVIADVVNGRTYSSVK